MILLTQKEYEEVKEKVKQIEGFIRKEILPYIKGSHEIPFGEEKTKLGKSHLSLCVFDYGDGIRGYSGYLLISFDAEFVASESGGGVSVYKSLSYGGNFGYQLIADWSNVKNRLLELKTKEEREISQRKSALSNFKI